MPGKNGATAEASTMTTNPNPAGTDAPPAGRSVPPKDEPQDTKPATGRRGRGRASKAAKSAPAPELSQKELAALGLLQVEAARLGQSVEDYVADLRAMVGAHDRLLEVIGSK
jgi:hypothetical protein